MDITIREQLHRQIDKLPDEIVEKIAQFTLSVSNNIAEYTDWQKEEWQEFSLGQFFSEDDDIEYSLEDAQEIY